MHHMPHPYRHPKTGMFWLRVRVPTDVRAAAGKSEVRRSLRTHDPHEARTRFPVAMAELQREWTALRAGPVALSYREVVALAGEMYRSLAEVGGQAQDAAVWRHLLDNASDRWLAGDLDALCLRHGIVPDDATRSALVKEIARAAREGFSVNLRAAEGDFSPDPVAARFPQLEARPVEAAPAKPVVTLSGLFTSWEKEHLAAGGSAHTSRSWGRMVRDFIAHVGHDDAAAVTPREVTAWVAHLRERGLAAKSIRSGNLSAVRTILAHGVKLHELASNPAEKVEVKADRAHRTRSKGFSDGEARVILTAALAEPPGPRRWLPFLLAYTGARIGELAQLRREDFHEEPAGAFMRISPAAGTVKTGLHRDVPLHPHLVEIGLLEWVERQKPGRLFPATSDDMTAEMVRDLLGLPPGRGELAPNHGWRHRFKTVAREAGIPRDAADAIQGHADGSASGGYGDWTVKALRPWVARIPRVELD